MADQPRRRFRFLKELASGGFGKVYLAEMVTGDNFSSVVALKLLHGKWTTNDEVVMRSRDEARLLGRLRHRNIVRVEDLTSIQGQCAIVMEYLQGVDLKTVTTWLRDNNRPFPRQSMFETVGAVAAALDAAYNQTPLQGGTPLQVIHRDIKPSNAMITIEGDVKVLDFGTARASFDDREAKTQALSFGSAAYMSPERLMGEEDTPAADIFSLGVTFYELLTLESFGKIHIRPEKYERSVDERVASVDVSGLPEKLGQEVTETLKLMLAYEPTGRPSAKAIIELMESFAEQARDGGLKRFARETVSEIIKVHAPEQDPNDPYTGTLLYEDSSSFTGAGPPATRTWGGEGGDTSGARGASGISAAIAKGASGTMSRSTSGAMSRSTSGASSPMTRGAVTSGAEPRARATISGAQPRGLPAPPIDAAPGPEVVIEDDNPFEVPEELAEQAPGGPPTPPLVATVTPGDRAPVVTAAPAPRPPVRDPEPPAPSGGGIAKVIVALGVLGFLAVCAVGVGWFLLRPAPAPPTIIEPPVVPNAALRAGADEMDFSANAAGKGGVILQIPTGATEVVVSSSTGFREEWDGSRNLRLRDLEPGVLRGKVKPKDGSASVYADFSVASDITCVYAFDEGGGEWKKAECR